MLVEDNEFFKRPTRGDRIRRSLAARKRRRMTKMAMVWTEFKQQVDAKNRLRAKRRLEKAKKTKRALDNTVNF